MIIGTGNKLDIDEMQERYSKNGGLYSPDLSGCERRVYEHDTNLPDVQ